MVECPRDATPCTRPMGGSAADQTVLQNVVPAVSKLKSPVQQQAMPWDQCMQACTQLRCGERERTGYLQHAMSCYSWFTAVPMINEALDLAHILADVSQCIISARCWEAAEVL